MDPVTLLGVVGSIASIVSLIRAEGRAVATHQVVDTFAAQNKALYAELDKQEVTRIVTIIVDVSQYDDLFLKRISEECLKEYEEAIKSGSNRKVDDEYHAARRCVCDNLRFVRRHHKGRLPSKSFHDLADMFDCVGT